MIEVVESAQRERDKFRLGLYTPPAGRPARLALLHPIHLYVFHITEIQSADTRLVDNNSSS